ICSRGCIYDCAYCWDPVFHKRKYRAMDPDNVLDLMKIVAKAYGKRGFIFGDDNFFIDLDWAYSILDRIACTDLNLHIGKIFIRADTLCGLDRDFLDVMVKAGVKRFVIGAESGSPRILRMIKKRITVEEIIEANLKVKPYNIRPQFVFMMGLPTETPKDVGKSIKLADRLISENSAATRSFNLYTPFPGTELYNMIVEKGYKEPERLEDWAGTGYRNISKETPWLPLETRKLVSVLNYALMSNRNDGCLGNVKKADPLAVWLSRIYGPLARWRVKTLNSRFAFEKFSIRFVLYLIGRDRTGRTLVLK
ncbi:MAG: B12-binding domain-containing radical SAM protein, partial [Anaerolineales bacterium]|nr:B12-binding domain-containing radical SAM protein [Anaerolineales bacterium]